MLFGVHPAKRNRDPHYAKEAISRETRFPIEPVAPAVSTIHHPKNIKFLLGDSPVIIDVI